MRRIPNIVIFYRNLDEVINYANQLSSQKLSSIVELVIVVNCFGKYSMRELREGLQSIGLNFYIYNPGTNLGYLNGLTYGYQEYTREVNTKCQWIIYSNTDIRFPNRDFIHNFANRTYSEDTWCVAPSVFSPRKKSYDNPEYIERCSINTINKLIFIHERPLLASIYGYLSRLKGRLARKTKIDSRFIYSGKGCFFFIRHELAIKLMERPFRSLMYSEESYVAEIIRLSNKKTYYDSSIEVIHDESAVTGKLKKRKKYQFIAESLTLIRDEFYNT